MKVIIEIDIPKETYSRITKWLKSYGAEGTLAEMLEQDVKNTVTRWNTKASVHFQTGLNAYERFKLKAGLTEDHNIGGNKSKEK